MSVEFPEDGIEIVRQLNADDIRALRESGVVPSLVPALPEIMIKNGDLSSLTTIAEEMLIAAGAPVYQRSGALVRPIIDTVDATRGRKTKIARLRCLDVIYTRDILGRHAIWQRWDPRNKKKVPVDAPKDIAAMMLARVGEWGFNPIYGIISSQTMRPDGSFCFKKALTMRPGYCWSSPRPCLLFQSGRPGEMQRAR
jgi:hypothetical protein